MNYYFDDFLQTTVFTIKFLDSKYDYFRYHTLKLLLNYKEQNTPNSEGDYYITILRDGGSIRIYSSNVDLVKELKELSDEQIPN